MTEIFNLKQFRDDELTSICVDLLVSAMEHSRSCKMKLTATSVFMGVLWETLQGIGMYSNNVSNNTAYCTREDSWQFFRSKLMLHVQPSQVITHGITS